MREHHLFGVEIWTLTGPLKVPFLFRILWWIYFGVKLHRADSLPDINPEDTLVNLGSQFRLDDGKRSEHNSWLHHCDDVSILTEAG